MVTRKKLLQLIILILILDNCAITSDHISSYLPLFSNRDSLRSIATANFKPSLKKLKEDTGQIKATTTSIMNRMFFGLTRNKLVAQQDIQQLVAVLGSDLSIDEIERLLFCFDIVMSEGGLGTIPFYERYLPYMSRATKTLVARGIERTDLIFEFVKGVSEMIAEVGFIHLGTAERLLNFIPEFATLVAIEDLNEIADFSSILAALADKSRGFSVQFVEDLPVIIKKNDTPSIKWLNRQLREYATEAYQNKSVSQREAMRMLDADIEKVEKRRITKSEKLDWRKEYGSLFVAFPYGLTLSELLDNLNLTERDSRLVYGLISCIKEIENKPEKEKIAIIATFQSLLYLLRKISDRSQFTRYSIRYLLISLFECTDVDAQKAWVQSTFTPIIIESLESKEIPAPGDVLSWNKVPYQDVLIYALAEDIHEGNYVIDREWAVGKIKRILKEQNISINVFSAFLLGWVYADCLRFFPNSLLKRVPETLARNHRFHKFDIGLILSGSTVWNQAYFGHNKGTDPEIGFNLLGLTSELGHFMAYLIEKYDLGTKQDEAKQGFSAVRSELYDRMFVLTAKSKRLLTDRAAGYIYHYCKYNEELLARLMDLPRTEASVELLYSLFPRLSGRAKVSNIGRGAIREALFSGGLDDLLSGIFSQSEVYFLSDKIKSGFTSLRLGIYSDQIPDFNFESNHKNACAEIKRTASEENQPRRLQEEIDYTLGIMAISKTRRADFVSVEEILKDDDIEYGGEKHVYAERIICDFIIQLVIAMYEAGISPRLQPYIVPKAMQHLIKTLESDDLSLDKSIEAINAINGNSIRLWMNEIENENCSSQPISPTLLSRMPRIFSTIRFRRKPLRPQRERGFSTKINLGIDSSA